MFMINKKTIKKYSFDSFFINNYFFRYLMQHRINKNIKTIFKPLDKILP